ncbi:MAG TPA: rhomboid family intramembrane serine protease [Mucilaginibacter sp.]|jgi:membrane associated rhomboid family serine protease
MNLKLITATLLLSPVTFIIMLIVFVTSCLALWKRKFFAALILHPFSVTHEREYYRLFTSDLVHNDKLHLLLNVFVLYAFCSDLEEYLRKHSTSGSWLFLVIYIAAMLTSAIITTIRHRKDFNYSTSGASGSIMGCMFSLMLINPKGTGLELAFVGSVKNVYSGLLYIIFLILFQLRRGEVNYEVHFWGAIGGIVATLIIYPGIL